MMVKREMLNRKIKKDGKQEFSPEIPREIDGQIQDLVIRQMNIKRYFFDLEEDITYVDGLVEFGRMLGKDFRGLETAKFRGYWFRDLQGWKDEMVKLRPEFEVGDE